MWQQPHWMGPQTRWVLLGVEKLETARGIPIVHRCRNYFYNGWLKNWERFDNLTLEVGLPLSICHFYQDNLSASNLISKSAKTKQVTRLLSKINLAQQYYADRLYTIIQTVTYNMIDDSLTKRKETYNYASFESNHLGVYELPIISLVSRGCVKFHAIAKFHLSLSCILRLHL